ncbi:hypothetical protein M0E87_04120 [Corynebacterium sp. CCM 9185]|uniref:Sortase n=1 Tax=Corynebacterium marambiense TaxID=2765364 RepID=A0ABS0VZX2_9CORY|nr:hypothetical protein [Corynebacterium marambiense]MBI9000882.1 hypothetical protein [Corynebacterium marambiense]MCK7662850.1 hypothetical protein [Corynebacterium marambiense]
MNEAPTGVRPRLRIVLSVLGVVLLIVATLAVVTAQTPGSPYEEASQHSPSATSTTTSAEVTSSPVASPTPEVIAAGESPTTAPGTADPVSVSPVASDVTVPGAPAPLTAETTRSAPPVAEPVALALPAPPHIPTPAAIGGLLGHNPNSGPAPGATGTFRLTGPAPVNGADYGPMAYVLPLNPPGPQNSMVRWVDGMGVSPTAAEQGTVYVLGHAWAQQWLVFNGFSELATRSVNLGGPPQWVPAYGGGTVRRWSTPVLNGSRITMSDAAGRQREWAVDNTWLVPKSEAINDVELNSTNIPGRIILIACAVGNGRDLDYNVIVSGHLV